MLLNNILITGGTSIPVGTIVGISCGFVILVCIIFARVGACCYSKDSYFHRLLTRCKRSCTQDDDSDSVDDDDSPPESPVNPSFFQPPGYEDAMNNPSYYPNPSVGMVMPPSYDSVTKGEFVEIRVPTPDRIESLRHDMLRRSREDVSSSSMQPMQISTIAIDDGDGIAGRPLESPPPMYSNIPFIMDESNQSQQPIMTPQTHRSMPDIIEEVTRNAHVNHQPGENMQTPRNTVAPYARPPRFFGQGPGSHDNLGYSSPTSENAPVFIPQGDSQPLDTTENQLRRVTHEGLGVENEGCETVDHGTEVAPDGRNTSYQTVQQDGPVENEDNGVYETIDDTALDI